MVIGDSVLTPAISVLSAVSGLQKHGNKLTDGQLYFDLTSFPGEIILISCVILVGLFALQHCGTHKVAFMFAPIVCIWLFAIFTVGLYNIICWNPKVVCALSPYYIVKFFKDTGKEGWISIGGILLCITGTEAMFADIGHFTAFSIRLAFVSTVYPCLIVQYLGQAAFLSKNISQIPNSFYDSVPDAVFWPVFVIATLAAIVGSQGVITATFSIVKQCHALQCFPRVKIVHTSKHIHGQIYIPEINWILMILTLAVTIGFQDTTLIGNAYGLAFMTVMLMTTLLMTFVIIFVWQRGILATPFLVVFGSIEAVYLSSALMKVLQGGWVPIMLSIIFMVIMYVWHYGTRKKYSFDLHNKVSMKWILGLGPSLGIVRVPGIGLIYSDLATGVPAIFSHFVTNLPAFHKVLVFVCVKSVPVPHVSPEEQFLIGRICPRPYRMYRCIVRYGYKDVTRDEADFENQLIRSIAEFIQMEAVEPQILGVESSSYDARMAVISNISVQSVSSLIMSEQDNAEVNETIQNSTKSSTLQSLRSVHDDHNMQARRRRVRFQLPETPAMDPEVRDELLELIEAKEAGVAYIMGHYYIKARRSSSVLKKLAIDIGYSFLRKNCRGRAVALNVPHISLIEVGMIYYV
ncbi:Potassium transporter 4 [Ancistrocladus abbreviatus]